MLNNKNVADVEVQAQVHLEDLKLLDDTLI